MTPVILNLTLFKIGWLACVFSAASGKPWAGMIAIAIVTVVHITTAKKPSKAMLLLGGAAATGIVWESFLVIAGWLEYSANSGSSFAPYWIVGMWVLFATTLNLGFRWLKDRLWLAAVIGAVGGPMAFIAGEKAGAVTFLEPTTAIIAICIGWAFLMPALVYASRFLDGHTLADASNAPIAS